MEKSEIPTEYKEWLSAEQTVTVKLSTTFNKFLRSAYRTHLTVS